MSPQNNDENCDDEHIINVFADVSKGDLGAIVKALEKLSADEDEIGQ